MKIALPFAEAMAIASSVPLVKRLVSGVRCQGSTIFANVDLRSMPASSKAMRVAFAAAGTVVVAVRVAGYSEGVLTLAVTAHARGLPAHKLLAYLLDAVNSAIRATGLPDGLVRLERGQSEPLVLIGVQRMVSSRTPGIMITRLALEDAVFHLEGHIVSVRSQ